MHRLNRMRPVDLLLDGMIRLTFGATATTVVADGYILLEDGFTLLLEDGFGLLGEDA